MNNQLKKIEIDKISNINSNALIDSEFKFVVLQFSGSYRIGSEGNNDGLYIFSKICSMYFMYETISLLVLDFRSLDYKFGNTILKSLDFFNEIGRDNEEKNKSILIVVSESNSKPIEKLLNLSTNTSCKVLFNYDEAISIAQTESLRCLTR